MIETIAPEYKVVDGIIRSPGKFEGEPRYAPYYWTAYLEGFADDDDGDTLSFEISEEEKEMFPELASEVCVFLRVQDGGHVSVYTAR